MYNLLKLAIVLTLFSCILCLKCAGPKNRLQVKKAGGDPYLPLVEYGENVYYYGAIMHGDMQEAIQFCRYHNMELVAIESYDENSFLFRSLEAFCGNDVYHFWTSGERSGDHFTWATTGKPMSYTNWAPGQPDNNNGNENCVEAIYNRTTGNLYWNDCECDYYMYTICKA